MTQLKIHHPSKRFERCLLIVVSHQKGRDRNQFIRDGSEILVLVKTIALRRIGLNGFFVVVIYHLKKDLREVDMKNETHQNDRLNNIFPKKSNRVNKFFGLPPIFTFSRTKTCMKTVRS